MKPIIIFPDNSANEITLSTEQLKKYIEDAYNQGYTDGIATVSYKPYRSLNLGEATCDSDTKQNGHKRDSDLQDIVDGYGLTKADTHRGLRRTMRIIGK